MVHGGNRGSKRDKATGLTARETEINGLLTSGWTCREVSNALHLSPFTVENHRANIAKKLKVAL